MPIPTSPSLPSRALLDEIRDRLQRAHFAARQLAWHDRAVPREPIADQLHAIRLLLAELDTSLASAV